MRNRARCCSAKVRRGYRPAVEVLEDRVLLSVGVTPYMAELDESLSEETTGKPPAYLSMPEMYGYGIMMKKGLEENFSLTNL